MTAFPWGNRLRWFGLKDGKHLEQGEQPWLCPSAKVQ